MLESGVRSQIHKPFGDQRLPEVLIAEATEGWVAAAMGSLELQNLVSNENDTWRMHRLIGEFWRAMLGADANTWRRSVSQIVNSRTGRFTAQYNWSDFRRLVPHALSLLGLGAEDRAAARLFGQIGGFALSYGIQPGDIRFAETSVAIHEKIAPESESLAASLNNLAEFQRYDNLKLAIATCKRVCDITAGLPDVGPAHPNYAIALSNLGTNYVRNKDLEKSEALFLDALRIDKSALGETHPQTTTDYRNLGGLYYELAAVNQGAVADAFRAKEAQVTEQALNLTLESLGPYHPEVATDRNNVAVMWDRDGRSEDALSLMAQAAATSVDLLGPGHEQAISTLGAYLNMAIVADAPLESAVLELKEVVIELKTLHRDWGKQRLGEIAARLGIELNDPEALLKALSAEQKRLHAEGAYEERIRWEVEQVQEALHAVTLEPHPSPQFQTNLIAALQALGIEVN
ncbi:MAG: tetratricopeptide repeat protein [Pseudomonadota bacterium]